MNLDDLGLDETLPLQRELIKSVLSSFMHEDNVVAGVLLGSLAAGTADRISDADVLIFTQNNFHNDSNRCFQTFESGKEIFYCLGGAHSENAYFRKYIFGDLTSAEIHCLDLSEPFEISKPFKVLFDKTGMVESRLTDIPAPKHEDFPTYVHGDKGLIWELFDCIKWLSRDNNQLAKNYLKKLSEKL
ncbi:nucleotidyltransferase domain-containing protein [Vibrio cholerae]|nr:nucleotidyltransferase domain-containing protein [Vibrio cholerae]